MLISRDSRPQLGVLGLRSWFTIQSSIRLAIWLSGVFSASAIFPQTAYCRINDPSLHPANIGAVEAALAAETFLRMARLFAELAHDEPDSFRLQIGRLDLPLAPLHGQIRWW